MKNKIYIYLFLISSPSLLQANYHCPSINEINQHLQKNHLQFIDVSTGFSTPWFITLPKNQTIDETVEFMGVMIPTKKEKKVLWPTCLYAYTTRDGYLRLDISIENLNMQKPFKGVIQNSEQYWETGYACYLPGTAIDILDCLFIDDH